MLFVSFSLAVIFIIKYKILNYNYGHMSRKPTIKITECQLPEFYRN